MPFSRLRFALFSPAFYVFMLMTAACSRHLMSQARAAAMIEDIRYSRRG